MLQTLHLHGFRGFESYRLTGLARVNLVVGKNNCGKTSILEAIELLVSQGDPRVLYKSLRRRGEQAHRMGERINVSHIFHGHACTPGAGFDLSSNGGKRTLKVTILSLDNVDEEADDWNRQVRMWGLRMFDLSGDTTLAPAFGMRVDRSDTEGQIVLPVMEDGTVGIDYKGYSSFVRNGHFRTPVHFLTLDGIVLDPASMGKIWSIALEESLEAEIVSDMRLLEPKINSIHFPSSRSGSSILIGLENVKRRLPINTYGDGMRRLLALRLSFVGAKGGVLLIDEIDTGLHWTVMEEMWQFVVEVAKRLNVQVFATTHSYDCIRGLGSLIRNHPDLEDQVSLQKMDRLLPEGVCLKGDQIKVAVEQDIEVR